MTSETVETNEYGMQILSFLVGAKPPWFGGIVDQV
jgi:hypothetical protein